jgi:hypothetical protein
VWDPLHVLFKLCIHLCYLSDEMKYDRIEGFVVVVKMRLSQCWAKGWVSSMILQHTVW